MKKRCCALTVLLAIVALISAAPAVASDPILIGISKIVAHPALDAIEKGVQEVVKSQYPDARFDPQNANGEMSTASSIAQKFKSENVTLAVGIATPTAQALVNTLKDRPVIFSAVTDPVGAGLIASTEKGEKNVTGISDMTPVKAQIELLNRIKPIKTLVKGTLSPEETINSDLGEIEFDKLAESRQGSGAKSDDAAESTPAFGDRRSHQMDPGNRREALRSALLVAAKGKDDAEEAQ